MWSVLGVLFFFIFYGLFFLWVRLWLAFFPFGFELLGDFFFQFCWFLVFSFFGVGGLWFSLFHFFFFFSFFFFIGSRLKTSSLRPGDGVPK